MTGSDRWWPTDAGELARLEAALVGAQPPPWHPSGASEVGASGCCFAPPAGHHVPSNAPSPGWAAACRPARDGPEIAVWGEPVRAPYVPGQLALREGPVRAAALQHLSRLPDVVLVTASGRDHPAGAGLATLLGALLEVPTIGITDRPLAAHGDLPPGTAGARTPLVLNGEVVGWWLRTQSGVRPVTVSAAWRTSPDVAVDVALASVRSARIPEPLRIARQAARDARRHALAEGRSRR